MINKTDKSFKTLINKEFTTPDRQYYQESGSDTINLHSRELWISDINTDPSIAISDGIAELYTKQILTPDKIYSTQAFYFMVDSGTFIAGVGNYDLGILNDARRYNFISDKYGTDYEVLLFDGNDIQISKTDSIGWYFDYVTGILHVSDFSAGSYILPFKVTLYKYTGSILSDIDLTDINSQYTIKNVFNTTEDMNNYTFMSLNDLCVNLEDRIVYIYNGVAWIQYFTLDNTDLSINTYKIYSNLDGSLLRSIRQIEYDNTANNNAHGQVFYANEGTIIQSIFVYFGTIASPLTFRLSIYSGNETTPTLLYTETSITYISNELCEIVLTTPLTLNSTGYYHFKLYNVSNTSYQIKYNSINNYLDGYRLSYNLFGTVTKYSDSDLYFYINYYIVDSVKVEVTLSEVNITGGYLNLNDNKIINLSDPTNDYDAVNLKTLIAYTTDNNYTYVNDFNANLGILPSSIVKGDIYRVAIPGTIEGTQLYLNDLLFANNTTDINITLSDFDIIHITSVFPYVVLDEDDMHSDSNTALATQQSIKAYVDNNISAIYDILSNNNSLCNIEIRDSFVPNVTIDPYTDYTLTLTKTISVKSDVEVIINDVTLNSTHLDYIKGTNSITLKNLSYLLDNTDKIDIIYLADIECADISDNLIYINNFAYDLYCNGLINISILVYNLNTISLTKTYKLVINDIEEYLITETIPLNGSKLISQQYTKVAGIYTFKIYDEYDNLLKDPILVQVLMEDFVITEALVLTKTSSNTIYSMFKIVNNGTESSDATYTLYLKDNGYNIISSIVLTSNISPCEINTFEHTFVITINGLYIVELYYNGSLIDSKNILMI